MHKKTNSAVLLTILANERTFLAYVRTALTLFIGGISMIQFFDTSALYFTGWILLLLTPAFLIAGLWKYHAVYRLLQQQNT